MSTTDILIAFACFNRKAPGNLDALLHLCPTNRDSTHIFKVSFKLLGTVLCMYLPCKNSANSNVLTQINEIFMSSSFFFLGTERIVCFVKTVSKRITWYQTSDSVGQPWVIVRSPGKRMFHLVDFSKLWNLHQEYIFHSLPWIKNLLFTELMCDQLIASKMKIKLLKPYCR